MGLGQLLVLYLLAGSGVATAMYLLPASRTRSALQSALALLFWPMFLPVLLARLADEKDNEPAAPPPSDEMAQAIARVDAELEGALRSLDGWAEVVLVREKDRLQELRAAWTHQAQRIREMDQILARLEHEGSRDPLAASQAICERVQTSQEVVRVNLQRLQSVRARSFQDLLATLAWVRELVSMIHLAKFTGAPASRAEELVAQIAAAVDGLSAVTWQDEAYPETLPAQSASSKAG